jgi:osmoprotectant transport system ATP-binding protein
MEKIVFRNVSKSFNGFQAVKDLSIEVMEGETLVLIGTSGCGKTTTLKMINRLIEPTGGAIEIDGRNVLDYDPIELRRGIGYVIQSIGLFPHMSIGKNISLVPELMKWPEEKTTARVDELLQMVGLEPGVFRERYPAELSGGQQQRVGVARALAADPPIVLADEPFGALDPITREQLQNEFLSLVRKIRKTIVFVTHDIFEAVKIADRLALMDRGRVVQVGTPKEVVETPANEFVADFLGKHHFELSLLLIRLAELMTAERPDIPGIESYPPLSPDDSMLDALNFLKNNALDTIPIRESDGGLRGYVTRRAVLERVIKARGAA